MTFGEGCCTTCPMKQRQCSWPSQVEQGITELRWAHGTLSGNGWEMDGNDMILGMSDRLSYENTGLRTLGQP